MRHQGRYKADRQSEIPSRTKDPASLRRVSVVVDQPCSVWEELGSAMFEQVLRHLCFVSGTGCASGRRFQKPVQPADPLG